MGHNNETNTPQRRLRCWGIFRRRFSSFSEQVSCDVRSSVYQQRDGDPVRSHFHLDTCIRYTPYAMPSCHQRSSFHTHDQGENMEEEQKSPENVIERSRQNRTLGCWFKITIPFGIKYDETWLLNLIQKTCNMPFIPVGFHYEKMQAQFFVENATVAFALKNVNGKILNKGEKVSIFVSPCNVPQSMLKQLKPGNSEQRMLPMNKLHDDSLLSLGLQRCYIDPDLMSRKPRDDMAASLQIHEQTVPRLLPLNLSKKNPYQLGGLTDDVMQNACRIKNLNLSKSEVKAAEELDRNKGLKPEVMCAEKNSLCTSFPDKSSNMSSILELFPKLLRLDGQDSLTPSNVGLPAEKKIPLPVCKVRRRIKQGFRGCMKSSITIVLFAFQGSFFGSEMLKNLVLQFLQQYYRIYDYGNRKSLLGAYHEQACFSLTLPFSRRDPAPSLWQYFKDSRNMIKLKDPYMRYQLLRHTNRNIVSTLCMLPQTQHDLSSFLVDLWVHTETMLCFSVHGVFNEVVGRSPFSARAFTRNFIAVPGNNSSLCIVNDELFVRDTICKESQNACSTPLPMPTCSLAHIPLQEQQEMSQAFATQSGVNLQWSPKCLQDKGWDNTRAAPILARPKVTSMDSGQIMMFWITEEDEHKYGACQLERVSEEYKDGAHWKGSKMVTVK
ncbi:PREDICTED: nuclear RNA export factor 3 [Condylura cristata]|uniref:nuclear RNA export factor 3 n=1 Tax=Condylura cristata TaxID=143302 RepID=UPI000643C5F6|nr:PREDICTED: nuclear RNA export factor 3 [Condylura cristata]